MQTLRITVFYFLFMNNTRMINEKIALVFLRTFRQFKQCTVQNVCIGNSLARFYWNTVLLVHYRDDHRCKLLTFGNIATFAKIVHFKSSERIYQTNVPETEYFLIRWGSLIRCETTKVWYDRLITNSFNFGGEFYTSLQYFKVTGQILTGKTGLFYFRLCH